MIHIKERKDMEDAFKKAQKPWAKLLQKVDKARSDYHTACKTERSASNQERNASGDSSFSPDQVIVDPYKSTVNNNIFLRSYADFRKEGGCGKNFFCY